VDVVWFRRLKSRDGSIVHTGDNRTGAGDGHRLFCAAVDSGSQSSCATSPASTPRPSRKI
jgi:stress response protein SCP2